MWRSRRAPAVGSRTQISGSSRSAHSSKANSASDSLDANGALAHPSSTGFNPTAADVGAIAEGLRSAGFEVGYVILGPGKLVPLP